MKWVQLMFFIAGIFQLSTALSSFLVLVFVASFSLSQLTVSIIFGSLLHLRLRALNLINLLFCLFLCWLFISICFKRILSNAMPCVAVIWCGLIWRWEIMMGDDDDESSWELSGERAITFIIFGIGFITENKWKMSELSFPRTVGVFFSPDSSAFGV